MATSKTHRNLTLSLRQCQVTNVNLTKEKHGSENVPRCDVSIRCLLEDVDMAEVIDAKGNVLQALWHTDKTPMLRDLKGPIGLDTKLEGTVELGLNNEHTAEFEEAIFKSLKIVPLMKLQAEATFQVRVDPGEQLALLEDLMIAEKGVFAFTGADARDKEPENQEKLDV